MKKLLFSLLISIIATHNLTAQTIIAQGTCGAQGDNLWWVLTSDSVLTISGVGEMENYSFWWHIDENDEQHITSNSPFGHRSDIKTVVIKEGVTSIGNSAFYKCSDLVSVIIPSSLTKIGEQSFAFCSSLISFTSYALIPPTIGRNSFVGVINYIAAVDNQEAFIRLYVPAQSVELYQYYWIGFEVFAIEKETKQRNFFQRLFGTRRNKL